jgi:hypothetical protein
MKKAVNMMAPRFRLIAAIARKRAAAIGATGLLALAVPACGYLAPLEPAEDAIIVKLVADERRTYDHPVGITDSELTAVLKGIRVEYKAGWLQKQITGPLKPLPLFEDAGLAGIIHPLVEALAKADRRERIVFYVSERRSDLRREVTAGSLFVREGMLHLILSNHRNGVDVIPGSHNYDRKYPEMAVAPQRFILTFARPEFVVERVPPLIETVFEGPPRLAVDYRLFLTVAGRDAART